MQPGVGIKYVTRGLAGRPLCLCGLLRIEGVSRILWRARPFHHFLPVGLGCFCSIVGPLGRSRMTHGCIWGDGVLFCLDLLQGRLWSVFSSS